MASADNRLYDFKWTRLDEADIVRHQKACPEAGSFSVEIENGLTISYGGQKTNIGGKGVITDFSNHPIHVSKTKRLEKKSGDLPYHNVEGAAGVLLGDGTSVFMWGGVDRFSGLYTQNSFKIDTKVRPGGRRARRAIDDFLVKVNVPEYSKIKGRFGHTLTLLDDGRVMLFGGKQRPNWETSLTSDLYLDTTPGGIFILDMETLLWTEATVDGDIPEGRAFHSILKVGGKLLMIGGISVEGSNVQYPYSYVLHYNNISGIFHSTRITSKINISHHTCNIIDNTLILSGGLNTIDDTINDKTFLIDIDDVNNIHTLHTGYAKFGHYTINLGSKLYTFGGRRNNKQVCMFSSMNEERGAVSDEDTIMSVPEDVSENSEVVSGTEASDDDVEQSESEMVIGAEAAEVSDDEQGDLEEVVPGFVCFMQQECVNVNAGAGVKDVMLSCAKCDQLFHLFCIGHKSYPFRSEEQQDNSLFYCSSCRATYQDELQPQMSRRQWQTLLKNFGIIKDHHL